MPLAYGIPYASLAEKDLARDIYYNTYYSYDKYKASGGIHVTPFYGKSTASQYGYLVSWEDLNAPALVYELLNEGILAKVGTANFRMPKEYPADEGRAFSRGSVLVPVQGQRQSAEVIFQTMKRLADKYKVVVKSVESGMVQEGSDLGSSRFVSITRPSIAMITGAGVNETDAGEVWHLLDQRMNIPATHLEQTMFNRVNLDKYNVLIMVGGSYNELNKEKLKTWVQDGGTLILTEEAVTWAAQNGISDVKFKKIKTATDSTQKISYTEREQIDGAQQVRGAIFGAETDLTHPLAYGYTEKTLSLFKANKVFMEKSRNPYATPFYYGANPLQSGWVSKENKDAIKNSAAVIVNTVGSGRVINIADNPNFRAFWLGGSKLFLNAIFFGRIIDAASARSEE